MIASDYVLGQRNRQSDRTKAWVRWSVPYGRPRHLCLWVNLRYLWIRRPPLWLTCFGYQLDSCGLVDWNGAMEEGGQLYQAVPCTTKQAQRVTVA